MVESYEITHSDMDAHPPGEGISRGGKGMRGHAFDMRDSKAFYASGGKFLENIIFRGLIDSLYSLNTDVPPIRKDGTPAQIRTRYRARWAATDTMKRTEEARAWVRDECPGLWGFVFRYRFDDIISWLEHKWIEVDLYPARSKSIRLMLSDCLVEDYNNE